MRIIDPLVRSGTTLGRRPNREIDRCRTAKLADLAQLRPLGFNKCRALAQTIAASAGRPRCAALLDN